ncbi:MAG: hypothetical protein OP8BY_0070 [Candidatus Saccharicenans subterraneus]|uniref:Uncharacterized protein n=1 Tax=Candidatus Saccharicenans subterraneus TaxID=2508984 RepID=A0A3E2BLR2_9BACT|nr:MAG: hypothetical protein OP8BY_0070 [Candidatus Saccharicenans subterraneum]
MEAEPRSGKISVAGPGPRWVKLVPGEMRVSTGRRSLDRLLQKAERISGQRILSQRRDGDAEKNS